MDTFQHTTLRKNGISIIVITICNIFIKLKQMQNCSKFRNSRCIWRTGGGKEVKLPRGPELYLHSLAYKKKKGNMLHMKNLDVVTCVFMLIFLYFSVCV